MSYLIISKKVHIKKTFHTQSTERNERDKKRNKGANHIVKECNFYPRCIPHNKKFRRDRALFDAQKIKLLVRVVVAVY